MNLSNFEKHIESQPKSQQKKPKERLEDKLARLDKQTLISLILQYAQIYKPIMDIKTYGRREEDLIIAERLLAVERARLHGTQGFSVDEFGHNMRQAIKKVAKENEQRG